MTAACCYHNVVFKRFFFEHLWPVLFNSKLQDRDIFLLFRLDVIYLLSDSRNIKAGHVTSVIIIIVLFTINKIGEVASDFIILISKTNEFSFL